MAFPATFNINYYQGDTYQFVVRPKTSTGEIFPITSAAYNSYFRIDTERGRLDGLGVEASASIADNSVTCTIAPSVGNSLDAEIVYYYDISIENKTDPNIVYTLLTGTINITADIAAE
jgi:hypothetical protein